MMIARRWSALSGREFFHIVLGRGCGENAGGDCADGFAAALDAIRGEGLETSRIARSRIWARDAAIRRTASDARLVALASDARAASASFIAPERLPPGIDVMIDLVAVAGVGRKEIREYQPRVAPPMFVGVDRIVFLSGNTDVSPGFEAQLERICANIETSLAAARAQWRGIARADAYVSNAVDQRRAFAGMRAKFPCPVSVTPVSGFSAPEKLIEIEVTATRE